VPVPSPILKKKQSFGTPRLHVLTICPWFSGLHWKKFFGVSPSKGPRWEGVYVLARVIGAIFFSTPPVGGRLCQGLLCGLIVFDGALSCWPTGSFTLVLPAFEKKQVPTQVSVAAKKPPPGVQLRPPARKPCVWGRSWDNWLF